MAKHIVVGNDGDHCPRCGDRTQVREHKSIGPRELSRPFYYSRWFYCVNKYCRTTLIMPYKFRVFNVDAETQSRLAAIRDQLGAAP